MSTTVTPFLMFQDNNAEEAMKLYASVIPNSQIMTLEKYGPNEPGAEGSVRAGMLSIGGLNLMFYDSYVKHAFTFTASSSLFVTCQTEEEIDAISAVLGEGGGFLMPLGSYGFSRKFAWLNDRFGVSWQINLP
jgi:predicted 3-demethylubiquinone-9 3-methyltransferase (glyoxalase superfamily)